MEGVEAPSYFLCPISLQIMRDPVALPTGITYERESIERWVFSGGQATCPVTKQPLAELELTPNHTVRRLIQAWCTANSSYGVERFPTPRAPVDKAQISKLIDEAWEPKTQLESLHKLKAIVSESERNKLVAEAAGVADVMASIIKSSISSSSEEAVTVAGEEALNVLYSLQASEQALLNFVAQHDDFVETLTAVMKLSSYQSRAYATLVLKSMASVMAPTRLIGFRKELFEEIVRVLRDRISHRATMAALKILAELCPWGRNRIRASKAGAVAELIELLLDEPERRECELALVVLEQLCGCAEGRAELVGHAAGIAVVTKRIIRVSAVATDRAVRILHLVSKFSATQGVLQEMLNVGAVSKLCMVMLHVGECGVKAREKAREMLMLHSRVWKNSPCIAPQLLASWPSAS